MIFYNNFSFLRHMHLCMCLAIRFCVGWWFGGLIRKRFEARGCAFPYPPPLVLNFQLVVTSSLGFLLKRDSCVFVWFWWWASFPFLRGVPIVYIGILFYVKNIIIKDVHGHCSRAPLLRTPHILDPDSCVPVQHVCQRKWLQDHRSKLFRKLYLTKTVGDPHFLFHEF